MGLEGEYLGLDNVSLANSSLWTQGSAVPINQSLIWYKVCASDDIISFGDKTWDIHYLGRPGIE